MRSICVFCALLFPAFAQSPKARAASRPAVVSLGALIEIIEFRDISAEQQSVLLARIGVRVRDRLTAQARHQIARALGGARGGLTFTYRPGSRTGTAKLIISKDC